MSAKRFRFFAALFLSLFGGQLLATVPPQLADLDDFVARAMGGLNVPGLAISVVRYKEVVYARGFGDSDLERKQPATPDTLFAIGSCAKAFTTLLMGQLVDEGKLDWDAPVRKLFPGFEMFDPAATASLTPRDMVTHRSGLPRHDLLWFANPTLSREDLVARLRYLEPTVPLRARAQYNNLMFVVAGHLVERITGKSWEDDVRTRIFAPLGMKRSICSVRAAGAENVLAQGYREVGGKLGRVECPDNALIGPAGGIYSSANDMARWALLHLGGGELDGHRIVSPETLSEIHTAQEVTGEGPDRPEQSAPAYALGWETYSYRGHAVVEHTGNRPGFSSRVTLLPDDGIGVVVLVNEDEADTVHTVLAFRIIDQLLGIPPIDRLGDALRRRASNRARAGSPGVEAVSLRKAGTSPSHALADYAGDYENPGYGLLHVAARDGQLECSYGILTAPLSHWHFDVWNSGLTSDGGRRLEDVKLVFRTDAKGNIAAVEAPLEPRVKAIVFTRKADARFFRPDYLARLTGDYELEDKRAVRVELEGSGLKVSLGGEPWLHLIPGLGGEFVIEEIPVTSVAFREDDRSHVTAIEFREPRVVFVAMRRSGR